jgi:hypothetical protein
MGVQRSFSVGVAARPFCLLSADWDAGALFRGARGGVEVLDVIGRTLRLGCRLHQHGRVVTQDVHPALEVRRAVVEGGVGNAAVG